MFFICLHHVHLPKAVAHRQNQSQSLCKPAVDRNLLVHKDQPMKFVMGQEMNHRIDFEECSNRADWHLQLRVVQHQMIGSFCDSGCRMNNSNNLTFDINLQFRTKLIGNLEVKILVLTLTLSVPKILIASEV